jgi:hypothetical protein
MIALISRHGVERQLRFEDAQRRGKIHNRFLAQHKPLNFLKRVLDCLRIRAQIFQQLVWVRGP